MKTDKGWAWMCALAGFWVHFLTGGVDRAAGVFYKEIVRNNADGQAAASTTFSALLYGTRFLGAPVAGVLCQYFGARRVVMSGSILSFSGILIASFTSSLTVTIFSLGLLTGIGNSMGYTSALLVINQYFHHRKATALGIASSGTGFGSFVLPLLAQFLIDQYSYSGCLMIFSAISFNLAACGALMYPFVETSNSSLPEEEAFVQQGKDRSVEVARKTNCCMHFLSDLLKKFDLKLFANPFFALFSIAAGLIGLGFKPIAVILPHYATLLLIGETPAVLLISVSGICDTITRFSIGWLFDIPKLARIRKHLWALAMLILGCIITSFSLANNYSSLLAISMCFGFVSGTFSSQLYTMLSDLIGRERCTSGIGLLTLSRGIGVACGPLLAGLLKDVTSGYYWSFISLGVSVFIAFLLLVCVNCFIKGK